MFHMFRFIYPLHFDVKDIHIRIYIIFHENFTQKTIYTASIYFLQGDSTAAIWKFISTKFSSTDTKFSVHSTRWFRAESTGVPHHNYRSYTTSVY
jgi:hypothetical protein